MIFPNRYMTTLELGIKPMTNYLCGNVFVGKQLESMSGLIGSKEHTAYLQVYQWCLERAAFGVLRVQAENKTHKEGNTRCYSFLIRWQGHCKAVHKILCRIAHGSIEIK